MSTDSRLGDLGTILNSPPSRRHQRQASPLEDGVVDANTPQPPADPKPKAKAEKHPATTEAKNTSGANANLPQVASRHRVNIRIDADLRKRLVQAAATTQVTYAGVVLKAIEQTHTEGTLAEALKGETTEQAGMFTTPISTEPEPKVLVEVSLLDPDLQVIDGLVQQHEASNRTNLITAALQIALGH